MWGVDLGMNIESAEALAGVMLLWLGQYFVETEPGLGSDLEWMTLPESRL
jgi:hypothetical protein